MVQLSAFEFETTVSKKCLKIAELLNNRRRIELLRYVRVRSLEILCYKTTVTGKSNRTKISWKSSKTTAAGQSYHSILSPYRATKLQSQEWALNYNIRKELLVQNISLRMELLYNSIKREWVINYNLKNNNNRQMKGMMAWEKSRERRQKRKRRTE